MIEHLFCALVILALLGVNYGLTQRLIRQSGQPRMKPTEALPDAMRDNYTGGKVERLPRQVTQSFKVGV